MLIDDKHAWSDELIEAILLRVSLEGWSDKALKMGASDINLSPADLAELFPNGPNDAIRYFSNWADQKMVEEIEISDISGLRISEKISFSAKTRLAILQPYREAVRRTTSILMAPNNALLSMKLIYESVDCIWYTVGDRSSDFSFYTKRGLLAGVLGSTTIFWLTDDSENSEETMSFLDRRIDDVMRLHRTRENLVRLRFRARKAFEIFGDVLKSRYARPSKGNSRVT
ncbi:MAG: COQ9 family protein [Pseudomonadota bacterium]|nr:COQ9 family protein [Pseudomonadota bacterium]